MASNKINMIGIISIIQEKIFSCLKKFQSNKNFLITIIASIRKNSAEFLGPKIIKNCFAISIAIILGIIIII